MFGARVNSPSPRHQDHTESRPRQKIIKMKSDPDDLLKTKEMINDKMSYADELLKMQRLILISL